MNKQQKVLAVIAQTGCDAELARETLIAEEWSVEAAVCDIQAFETA